MARMIPAFCPAGAPPGENELYAQLAESRETGDALVLRSAPVLCIRLVHTCSSTRTNAGRTRVTAMAGA